MITSISYGQFPILSSNILNSPVCVTHIVFGYRYFPRIYLWLTRHEMEWVSNWFILIYVVQICIPWNKSLSFPPSHIMWWNIYLPPTIKHRCDDPTIRMRMKHILLVRLWGTHLCRVSLQKQDGDRVFCLIIDATAFFLSWLFIFFLRRY